MTGSSLKYCFCAVLLAVGALLRPQTANAGVAKAVVLETNVAYLRIDQTEKGLPDEITAAINDLEATNNLTGLVLDLRFASGGDADGLKAAEQVLEQSHLPLAILINGQTSGGAVTLAGDLRNARAGLVFGAAADDLQPDIAVAVSAADEKVFFKNPYGVLKPGDADSASTTNLLPFVDIDHTTEADLVRNRIKDGDQSGLPGPEMTAEAQRPYIHDPVLAHGLDFIKGVVALHLNRSEG